MKFPASTSTSFDDLMKIKTGDYFVLRGYEYCAQGDARTDRIYGIERVTITAKRHEGPWWIAADVMETRAYVAPLDEILSPEER